MIRSQNDFSFPVQRTPASQAAGSNKNSENFTLSSKTALTKNKISLAKKGSEDRAVIKGGVKHSRQHEERRFKLCKQANFEYLQKMQEEKLKKTSDEKNRTNKLLNLIKTKNILLHTKSDIEDFKTKVNNQIRESLQPKSPPNLMIFSEKPLSAKKPTT